MRVLLLGASGLIGAAVAARLRTAGHEVVGISRNLDPMARRVPVARWIEVDLRLIDGPQDWLPHITGVDGLRPA